jgi:hypothetical protein
MFSLHKRLQLSMPVTAGDTIGRLMKFYEMIDILGD